MTAARKVDTASPRIGTIQDFLSKRGILPDPKFNDYQDYIEKKQDELKTEVVEPNLISTRGNVHLAMGEVFRMKPPGLLKSIIRRIYGHDRRT